MSDAENAYYRGMGIDPPNSTQAQEKGCNYSFPFYWKKSCVMALVIVSLVVLEFEQSVQEN